MEDYNKIIKRVLLTVIFLILVIPFIQSRFNFITLTPLKGAITQEQKKQFTLKDWFSGAYQEQEEKYLNESFGFRSLFVRVNNQLAFSLFKKAKANGVIIGKKNYLFEENYIKAYYGTDFIGTDSISLRMQKLSFIQDTLAKLHKNLILVFAAGKGSYYPEFFPDKFRIQRNVTNYEMHTALAREMNLNFIDFNKYFIVNKYQSKYPLYPQYGIHWSYYGMCLAADSIVRYIEKIRNIDMPNFFWNETEWDYPRETDYDLADGMNIKFKLKTFKMAYPRLQFQSDSGKTKPSVLVISDSFYWGMFGSGIITRSFSENQFWYYNKEVHPSGKGTPLTTDQVDLREAIASHDVIIIMATEATLTGFGWGFIENVYNMFKGMRPVADK